MPLSTADRDRLVSQHPVLADVMTGREIVWENRSSPPPSPDLTKTASLAMRDADARLSRLAPLIALVFPETAPMEGLIESPLVKLDKLANRFSHPGALLLKRDSDLPIAGSVKARGGIHEVLKYAEDTAIGAGLHEIGGDPRRLASPACRDLFSNREIVVGSTGNLGLSVGISGARLGFKVTVHMSADAKAWKKDMLRRNGATVVEHADDYSKAVEEGRRQTENNPNAHFVDDERSLDLFSGYAVAALRLGPQLRALGLGPTADHPLNVYLPCGVGGAPAGIAFGLDAVFGDAVRSWIVEPTHSPCMTLGLVTGLRDGVSVRDFGLDNRTEADGLAVGRPSGLAIGIAGHLFKGCLTVDDSRLAPWVRDIHEAEGYFIEPSAAAACIGPEKRPGAGMSLLWATGGALVPASLRSILLGTK